MVSNQKATSFCAVSALVEKAWIIQDKITGPAYRSRINLQDRSRIRPRNRNCWLADPSRPPYFSKFFTSCGAFLKTPSSPPLDYCSFFSTFSKHTSSHWYILTYIPKMSTSSSPTESKRNAFRRGLQKETATKHNCMTTNTWLSRMIGPWAQMAMAYWTFRPRVIYVQCSEKTCFRTPPFSEILLRHSLHPPRL
jgi:hypothetical protein